MASLLACGACSGMSCAANGICSCFGSLANRSNKLTRVAYTLIFLTVSLMAWSWYSWGWEWYQKIFPNSVIHWKCPQEICFGAMSVYRITLALFVFFLIHAMMAAICRHSKINTRWWGLKIFLILVAIAALFAVPNSAFRIWAWIALVGAAIFTIVQLILLIDFTHSWTESWIQNWNEQKENIKWYYGLLASALTLYLISATLTVADIVVFTQEKGCIGNISFILVNTFLIIIESALSIWEKVQIRNPRSGLLQAATVAAYTSYLIWSALMSDPDKCSHLFGKKESFSSLVGAIILIISVCYSAFRVSTKEKAFFNLEEGRQSEYDLSPILNKNNLQDTSNDENSSLTEIREENNSFNYTFFHICFSLASCYVTMLITNWGIVYMKNDDTQNYIIGKSKGSMWVKIISSWVAHLLYIWSLVIPILFPDRDFS